MYWLVLLIAGISGFFVLNSIRYFDEVKKTPFGIALIIFIISLAYCYFNSSRFDEVETNYYNYVIDYKEECTKYQSCKKILKEILEDGKILKFEFQEFDNALKIERNKLEKIKELKEDFERERKTKEQLEQIKKELEKK